jgi:hypothetical protein
MYKNMLDARTNNGWYITNVCGLEKQKTIARNAWKRQMQPILNAQKISPGDDAMQSKSKSTPKQQERSTQQL